MQPIYGDKLNHPDIIAHIDTSLSPYTVEAPAGKYVTSHWYYKGSCFEEEKGWDCSDYGWTATYLDPCNSNCAEVNDTKIGFFKIYRRALIDYCKGRYAEGKPQGQSGCWATDAISFNIKITGGNDSARVPAGAKGENLYQVDDTLLQWDLY